MHKMLFWYRCPCTTALAEVSASATQRCDVLLSPGVAVACRRENGYQMNAFHMNCSFIALTGARNA
jgi:hypothetical protein